MMSASEQSETRRIDVCLIEDDPIMGESMVNRFELEGFSIHWQHDAEQARKALRAWDYGLVISDIRLPDLNGDRLFEELYQQVAGLPPFIFITGFGDLERAVELLKAGAADYLTKPFDIERLLERVTELLPVRNADAHAQSTNLGISRPMRNIETLVRRLGTVNAGVLITGETGTGKEVVARYLHDSGRGGPFFAVNCAAIPEGLIESELFGHEKGAFTGAAQSHRGVFERACGGTLFLDEIGDMPVSMQARLLRVLQEQVINRVGGEHLVPVDVRLICATHQDLKKRVGEGCFREDLLYRIDVVHIHIPPLRERAEDILWLARKFLDQWSRKQGQARKHLDPDAEQALLEHDWPGNVRDLRHCLERACIFTEGTTIRREALFPAGMGGLCEATASTAPNPGLREYLTSCEKRYIEHCLETNEGRIGDTAEDLGISRKSLWERMRKLHIG